MSDIDLTLLAPRLNELAPRGRTALLPALHAAQELYGYIPEAAAAVIGQALGVPLADVFGVVDFYTLFYREPIGDTVIHVCNDPACAMAGADAMLKLLSQHEDLAGSEGGAGKITVEHSPCLGLCEHAPAMMVQGRSFLPAAPGSYEALAAAVRSIASRAAHPHSRVYQEIAVLTANCGRGYTVPLSEYEERGGYTGLRKALGMTPEAVVAEVKASGLVGRGGAAFPTGIKWEGAQKAAGQPKYVVCNADEAEPGTFKDRVLLEDDPHHPLEGLIIAAYAVGASQGYIYVRGEYRYQFEAMQHAVEEAHQAGYLGEHILGSGFSLDVEVRRGAGAYICGEETAQFESIEGKRGFPRIKPPFPTTHGLFGQPTAINNVETLANIPYLITVGAAGYRQVGTEKSPGPKLFCLSGDVGRPGLYEVPFGVTLRHLLFDLAGGVRSGHSLEAVLIGGAAGAFATEKDLDVPLSFEGLRAAGLPLGSGVITVFDESRDMRDILMRLSRFFADESCGKCYPCQIGTQRQYEILQRAADSRSLPGDLERLEDVGWTMTDASLCGLGQTAASAVLSALRLWPDLLASAPKVSATPTERTAHD
jgi:NADH-quinone oxidoreductase subunit F